MRKGEHYMHNKKMGFIMGERITVQTPIKIMAVDGIWAMVRRSDIKGAMPYACKIKELEKEKES